MDAKKISSTLTRVMGNEAVTAMEFEGYKWKVGVTTGANIEYLYTINDLIKNAHLFIKHITNNEPNKKIAISLPAESFKDSKVQENGGIVQKFKDTIKKNIPSIEEIIIYPQGVIALDYLVETKKVDPALGNVLIIDGGFNTVNVSVISPTGEILFTETIHDELGIYNLLVDFFRIELQAKHEEVSPNAQILKKVFLEEVIDGGFTTVNVKTEKQRAVSAFISKLISRITNDLKKKKISFDQFLFVGGVSYYISKDNIQTTKPFYIPEKDGEFLTALGMRKRAGEDCSIFDIGFGDTKYIL